MQRSLQICLAVLLGTVASPASALLIGFEQFTNGQIVANGTADYGDFGLTVHQRDRGGYPFDVATAFDTRLFSATDPDLAEGDGYWVGNLAPNPNPSLGNILILQEDRRCADGLCDHPDDWGRGTFFFEFDEAFESFAFDLIDVEERWAHDGFIEFYLEGQEVKRYSFIDFICHPFFLDQGIEFGDHSANRVDVGDVGPYDAIRIEMGGSGGIDNIATAGEVVVPEPGTAALVSLGLLSLVFARRRSIA